MPSLEIRFHGRGGQGTVLAAKILADVVLRAGAGECLAIPEFGVERRGAPVTAYARIAPGKIRVRSRIYEPDAVVVLDETLAGSPEIVKGLKPGGIILINAEPSAELAARRPGFKVTAVPARRIAVAHKLGSAAAPLVNTAMCGAMAAVFELAGEDALVEAVRASVPLKHDENAAAALEAYRFCRESAHAPA